MKPTDGGNFVRLSRYALLRGETADTSRRRAQRGEIVAVQDASGHWLVAADELRRLDVVGSNVCDREGDRDDEASGGR